MNETIKKFSVDLLKDFQAALAKQKTSELVEKVKAASDSVSFKVIISTSDEDRQGDSLDQSKWKLDNYKSNPVVLWAHDYYEPPIAVCTSISVQNGKLVAEGKFASADLNPFAAQVAGLYEAGYINTTSVGYIQHEDGELELLEFSFVPVPANPYALSMRDMKKLNLNTAELVMKGLRFITKAEQAGDSCQLEDGTSGVLAEDDDNPGQLICIPTEGKAIKSNENDGEMNNDLIKTIDAEHDRHQQEVGKAIDEFSDSDKALDEFHQKIDSEQDTHLQKCMKAIDDNYELQDQKKAATKSIEEFKDAFTAEHTTHVKTCDKAIDEFKSAYSGAESDEDKQKAIDQFTTKAVDEMSRHKQAHLDMCKAEMGQSDEDNKAATEAQEKGAVAEEMAEDQERQMKYKRLDRAYEVFYAFTSAYLDDATPVDQFEALLDEAVSLMKNLETTAKGMLAKHLESKAGRQISAKNKEKIQSTIKALEQHHDEHGKSTNDVIAALKELMGSEEGDEGKEQKPPEKGSAPNSRSSTSGAVNKKDSKPGATSELEAYLISQRLVRQVKSASEEVLRQLNNQIKRVS